MTLNDLERQFTAFCVFLIVTKRLRLELRDFRYKVALYMSYMCIKFYDEFQTIHSNFKPTFGLRCRLTSVS